MPDAPSASDQDPRSDDQDRRLEEVLQRLELDEPSTDKLRTVIRLMVGGALIGWDEVLAHLEQWDEEVRGAGSREDNRSGRRIYVPPGVGEGAAPAEAGRRPQSTGQELRYLLLGLLFETESRLYERGSAALEVAGQTTDALLSPLRRRIERSDRLRPARSRFERLVKKGEAVTDRWIQRGRLEEAHSRGLVLTATQDTFDASMEQLGQAPELQNLVKMQSAGLSREVLDEVRARTVSGDILAEGFVRRLLRRAPRGELPEAPTAAGENRPPPS